MKTKLFTLIELLVVVAIIGILAALLLPTLSKVRYRTRLVVCLNNQKQVAVGAVMYTNDNASHWPYRSAYNHSTDSQTSANSWCNTLRANNGGSFDERPLLNDVFPINELQCPFVEQLDLLNSTRSIVMGGYGFNFGWKYAGNANKGMLKVGDDMVFAGKEFDVIVSDFTHTNKGYPYSRSTHPDYGTGSMKLLIGIYADWSRYMVSSTYLRGPVDLNFTRKDGSAFLIRGVRAEDSRLQKVPYNFQKNDFPNQFSLLPDADYTQ